MLQNHVATSYQLDCIDNFYNIPVIKQRSIHEQWNHNTGILRHIQELVAHCKLINSISLSCYSLRVFHIYYSYSDKTESISFIMKKTMVITLSKKTTISKQTKNNRNNSKNWSKSSPIPKFHRTYFQAWYYSDDICK